MSICSSQKMAISGASIVVLGFLVSMGALHTDPIAASLPGMARELECSTYGTATVVSSFLLGLMFGHLLIGPLSDILGRRCSILLGLSILCCGAVLCATAPSIEFLIFGRVVQGLGAASALCSARAIGGDAGDRLCAAKVLSLMQIISCTTPIFMPLLGNGIAQISNWRTVFWMMLAVDLLLLLGTLFFIPETHAVGNGHAWRQLGHDLLAALHRPRFLLYTFAFGFGISTFYCYTSASSFALQHELGISATVYSRFLSGMGILMVFTAILASRLPRYFGLVKAFIGTVILQFFCAAALSITFFTGCATVLSTVILYALIAGASSIIIPIGLSLAVGESGPIKGTASALCGFVQCLCSWCITSLLSVIKAEISIGGVAGLAMSITTLSALICCLAAVRLQPGDTAS